MSACVINPSMLRIEVAKNLAVEAFAWLRSVKVDDYWVDDA